MNILLCTEVTWEQKNRKDAIINSELPEQECHRGRKEAAGLWAENQHQGREAAPQMPWKPSHIVSLAQCNKKKKTTEMNDMIALEFMCINFFFSFLGCTSPRKSRAAFAVPTEILPGVTTIFSGLCRAYRKCVPYEEVLSTCKTSNTWGGWGKVDSPSLKAGIILYRLYYLYLKLCWYLSRLLRARVLLVGNLGWMTKDLRRGCLR